MKINLEKELSELADLFEYGHLLAEADPRCFINTVVAEIKQLRKSPWIKVSDQEPPKDGEPLCVIHPNGFPAWRKWVEGWLQPSNGKFIDGWADEYNEFISTEIIFKYWQRFPE